MRNNWFLLIHDFLKDSLLFGVGVLKYQWVKDEQSVKKRYTGLSDIELATILKQDQAELLEVEVRTETAIDPYGMQSESPPIYDATVQTIIKDEYPLIEAVPLEEVYFPLRIRGLDQCPFFTHRVQLFPWEVTKRYGKKAIDKLNEWRNSIGPAPDDSLLDQQRWADLGGDSFFSNQDDERYWIYECYYPDPETGEQQVTHLCGEVILEHSENKYGRPPFILGTPIKMSHRVVGKSFHDLVREIQRLRTVLMRMVMDSVYFSNYGRTVIDENRVNLDDFLNQNFPGGVIRGDPAGISVLQHTPLQGWVFNLFEGIMAERENRTGVTRYNQGLDAKSLNKTARGISAILSQSAQRIEMVARVIAEMSIGPLIQAVIDMNTKFLTRKTAIRIMNEWAELSPDNIVGRFDTVVNVGIGTGNKDQIITQIQQLLGLYAQIAQTGVPIVTPQNVHHAMSELVRAMGFRNAKDFVTDPEQKQAMSAALQALEMCMQDIQRMSGTPPPPQALQVLQAARAAIGDPAGKEQAATPGGVDAGMVDPRSQPEMAIGPMPAMAYTGG
jgi:hypothetical protein